MKTTLKIVAGIATLLFFMYLGAYMMSPGSNSRAEYYRIDIPTDQIIEKVAEFKEKCPQYKIRRIDKDGNPYEYTSNDTDFFHLYLPSLDLVVSCFIKNVDGKSRIGLKGASKGSNLGGFENLNSGELPRKLNQKIKKVFEEEFLDRMGKWEHVNTGNSFFGLYF